ncbi:P-loop NTPase [Actinokineospora auranticolor]|uniref:MinD-like ATPase involved in chromosome partitioning or flagellar assembly n=1 Tax=Actinokineospora auranticolor TaxID=155976 RepID=A0A2S6GC17_9PSEU|nr:P-loop NTPase [Actinokineospora auranticolor]PPK62031.1 MinD-like ATPase involved in chromosome partitioning or flagellar assembly [Actinokineospora auranticolor]
MSAHIITVTGGRAGCGKSTVAANLAAVLATRRTGPVCLVDLDFAAGTIADMFDAEADAGGVPEAHVATRLAHGLYAVLAPTILGDPGRLPERVVSELLAVLSTMYSYVVIDTPSVVNKHVLTALEYAHQQILITTPERPGLRGLRQVHSMLDLLDHSPALRTVVVNRAISDSGLPEGEIVEAARAPIAAWLPTTADVPQSINNGHPLATMDPGHPFSAAVRELALTHVCHV